MIALRRYSLELVEHADAGPDHTAFELARGTTIARAARALVDLGHPLPPEGD